MAGSAAIAGSATAASVTPFRVHGRALGELVQAPGSADLTTGVILHLHGGGYVSSSVRAYRSVTTHLSALSGLPVVSVDYSRAPEHRFPAALDDVVAAYDQLLASGVTPDRVVIAGDSAGAHLALGLLITLAGRAAAMPAGVALSSPVLDPSLTAAISADRERSDPVMSPEFARRCSAAYVGDQPLDDPRISPLLATDDALRTFPATLVQVGDTECFRSDALRWHERLTGVGVPSVLHVASGQVHSYLALNRMLPEARSALSEIAQFAVACLDDDLRGDLRSGRWTPKEDDMTRWYPLEPADDEFLDTAPVRTEQVLDVPVSTDRLWAALTADDAVCGWSRAVTATRWTTPRPYGVGTIREVTIGGAVTVREQFYRWEEGRRKTFFVPESTRPGIRRFAEDYRVEETPTGSRLTWVVAVEPRLALGPASGAASRVLGLAVGSLVGGLRRKLT